jgi:hypothetical protein
MKRPPGFTIMALALGWLAFAGFGNAFIGITNGILRFLTLIYAITAIVTAIGLWKMRTWAFQSYLAWAVVVVFTMLAMQLGRFKSSLLLFVGFACFISILLWLSAKYVRRTLIKNIEQS